MFKTRVSTMVVALFALLGMLAVSAPAQTVTLFDFEGDLEGWGPSGFGNGTEFVNLSGVGATSGTGSMAFGHSSGQFSWDASWVMDDQSPNTVYNILSAVAGNPTNALLEFDLTYRANDLPSLMTFANVSFSLQSDNGFKQVDGIAQIGAPMDSTQTISLPLDGPTTGGDISGFAAMSSFYRMTIALNTDASATGPLTDTIYVDNIRISVVPEPSSVVLLLLPLLGIVHWIRQR